MAPSAQPNKVRGVENDNLSMVSTHNAVQNYTFLTERPNLYTQKVFRLNKLPFCYLESAEEVCYVHTFLAGLLQTQNIQPSVGSGDTQE